MEQMVPDERREYEEFKEELGRKLDETSENFVVIGYILKQVRDKELFRQESYSDIYGFGLGTYGLSKATVSRFMNINTKFSVDGNSREIRPEYKGYGRSKLQEMLNIDESDMELITAASTVEDIRELGKAEKAQRQLEKEEYENNLPLIRMAADPEEKAPEPGQEPVDPFDAMLAVFWEKNRELYSKVAAGLLPPEIAAEEISPSGSSTFRDGVNMMFFYDFDKGLKLRSYAKGKAEITQYTYQELIDRTMNLNLAEPHEDNLPKESVAASQLEPETGSDEQPVPYVLVPGQTSVSDLQGVVPDNNTSVNEDADAELTATSAPVMDESGTVADANMENVIDGEYRELEGEDAGQMEFTDIPYTDDEIKRVIAYFDFEYAKELGMIGTHAGNKLRRLSCRVARECIRERYSAIAEQVDREASGAQEGTEAGHDED